ncbi:putative 2-dehydropantoate 2-reductase [Phaeomoniella chlamydospora]|uniref:2-dehydropantoate 2-reductase n=1 Tax=Phaeomoniella chlamydospora TaxID=158046 RepID=A0A0G2E3E8_PHACM|nr:putative 2-dehydropantoate 2-reductase [Phaeomoniella chlamydospora]
MPHRQSFPGQNVKAALANLPADRRPPITLLLHREGLWEDFREKVCKIRVSKPFASKSDHDGTAGFDVEVQSSSEGGKWDHKHTASHNLPEDTQIDCLIVTVKGAMTVDALRSVRGRLKGPGSTVLLMQNGMGQRDELDAEIFRDPSTRPKYMQGIISHGAYLTDPFTATHAGNGDIQLGMLSDTPSLAPASAGLIRALGREEIENNLWSESARHLAGSLMESDLNCSLRTCAEVLTTQLLKLAVNATNNTLTALLDIINGHQLSNPIISGDIFPALISEISQILLSLPEVSDAVIGPHSRARFERHNLERFIRDMIKVNKTNSSSTREDMRRKKETELRYINGFLVKRGNELGKDVKLNELLLWLVQAKTLEVQGKVQQVD